VKSKQLAVIAAVALIAGAVSFVAGYAAAPDSPAHLLARTAEEWTALAAWVAVAIAGGTAVIALQQMFEARRLRIDQAQPQIVAYLEQDPDMPDVIEIVIGNFGTTAARDVKVSTSVPVRATSSSFASSEPEVLALPERFATLAPGQRWRTAWDFGSTRADHHELKEENRVTFRFDYVGVDGKPVHTESDLDWAEIAARWWARKQTIHHATGELVGIRKALEAQSRVAWRRATRRDAAAPIASAHPAPAPAAEAAPAEGKVAALYRVFTRGR
jgi:hypothetical protein